MPVDSSQENPKSTILWVIIFWSSLFCLALFWSVDSSFIYIFLAISAFSFFKIIQSRQSETSSSSEEYEDESYSTSTNQNFWRNVKNEFAGQTSQSQVKVIVLIVSGFIGFLIFILVVGSLLDSPEVNSIEYQQRASDFYMNQQYDSAVYYYGLALQGDPENPDLWLERGNSFLYVPNVDSSLVMYQRALELDPTFEQAQYNIGYIYFERKNYLNAIQETRKILAYNPDYTEAKLLIGDSFYNRSQLDSALQWYESAYQSGYRSAVLCHLMAYIYDTKGETSLAINFYREAIGQDSTIVDIYVRLGELVPGEEGNWFREKSAYLQSQGN